MTLRAYLIIMSITTAICWLAWFFVVYTVDPNITSRIGLALFYISLFLAIVGTTAILGFIVRFAALKKELAFRSVKEAFRQSFLFALLVSVSLFLLSQGLFTWLNLILLVVCLSILEFFMLSYSKQ